MSARDVSTAAPCPTCGEDLSVTSDVEIVNWIPAASAPQGEPVADLVLKCTACGALLNTFVALSQFAVVPHD